MAVFVSSSAAAQVTGSGNPGKVSKFTGSSSIGDSPISIGSDNKVGVNWDTPIAPLDVGGFIHVYGNTNQSIGTQGAYLGWNTLTGGTGETDFINSRGGGGGGFVFMNGGAGSSTIDTLMFLEGSGRVGIGTVAPGEKLEVNGNVKLTAGNGFPHHVF